MLTPAADRKFPRRMSSRPPPDVDHLVYAVPDLRSGIEAVERVLGVRAEVGGRHPRYGTHNALLSLGPATYLEIVSADPELPRPARGRPFGVDAPGLPRLATWVLRDEAIEERAARAAAAGLALGAVQGGERARPDGSMVRWRLTDPYAMPVDGLVPFLIAWGSTPHPGSSAPAVGTLIGLRAEHPLPDPLRQAFAALGIDLDVAAAPRPGLVATLKVGDRVVELR